MPASFLFIGGTGPSPRQLQRLIRPGDLICAADSGLDAALAAGFEPAGVVGDMDSLSNMALLDRFPADAVEIHQGDKDDTDTKIGINWLRTRGAVDIILIGGGEGRLDHTLAIKALFDGPEAPSRWYTALEEIRCLDSGEMLKFTEGGDGMADFKVTPDESVSFFTAGDGPWDIHSRGFRWELDNVDWESGDVSLSNRFTTAAPQLEIRSGRLLMIRPIDQALS